MMRCVHIVDGDAGFRDSLRALLSARSDLVIRCYASGDAFLADAADLDPGVLLLDLHLAGASGLEHDDLKPIRHCEERSDAAIQAGMSTFRPGLPRYARNDESKKGRHALDVLTAAHGHAAIVLTDCGEVACAVAAMKAGAMDLLQKPFDPVRLLALIDAGFARLERDAAAARRTRAARARITRLSPREGDVFRGLLDGRPNKAIASDLDLSPRTVELHRARVMEKLAVASLPEAMRIAFHAGLFAAD